ncbi:MAG TPA: cupredoxin domain-containing protein [Archangium sp.]|uniref:cupredoxin domain-containing protein n=1 Tax=Archangium sp. TaxID=1872627 RepID=UPI002E3521BF|nr:cupredoxin domain-containing protein [Archangium sp.]HEX5751017.1 cupredoxin domain-containing protein [Archangium sp.]
MWKPGSLIAALLALSPAVGVLPPMNAHAGEAPTPREVQVRVERGYNPARIEVREGERVRLTFLRTEYTPCTKEVVFPTLGIREELPPHQPVTVELPPQKVGEVEFHCGMKMSRGKVVVTPHAHEAH